MRLCINPQIVVPQLCPVAHAGRALVLAVIHTAWRCVLCTPLLRCFLHGPAGLCTALACTCNPSCSLVCIPATFHARCSLAAELAAADGAKGPGSLRVGLLDNLWNMNGEQLLTGARVSEA